MSKLTIIVIEKFGYGYSDLYECPILMFISDGKQVSSGWIDHEREFAALMDAKTVYLNCGHYIHYYESERISQEIEMFVNQIMKL